MSDAMPALNDSVNRAVADIEAELERVALLRSGLPTLTNVLPGEYASALEAHLSSVSSALQLELEQKLQAPGMTGTCRSVLSLRCPPIRPPARPPGGVGLDPPRRLTGGRSDARLRGSSKVRAPRPRFPRQAPDRGERNPQSQSTDLPPASPDSHHVCMHARRDRGSMPGPAFRAACHAAEAAPTFFLFFCRAQPRGISRAMDGCAASSASSVSASIKASLKMRPRSSQLFVLPSPLGILVWIGPAPSAGRPVAPSSMRTWRCSRGATVSTRIFFCRHHSINTSSNCHGNAR
jgi:hypothetical protein